MSNDAFKKGLDELSGGTPPSEPADAGAPPQTGDLPPHPTVDALRTVFGAELILRHEVVAGDEHIVYVDPGFAFDVLKWLRDTPEHRYDFLQDLTAVDYGGGRRLQVVYQLWSTVTKLNLRLKVELPLDALELPTVYFLWRAADWMEREVYDMFGVVFQGHPDLRRILMPYNYAEGHPLRKDFPLRGRFSRAEQTRRSLSMRTEDHYSPGELQTAHLLGQALPEPFVHGEGGGAGTAGIGGAG